MKISIIVPIYNAEKYLHRCIHSLLNQGLIESEYEILLINDGSKDNSLSICNEFQSQYPSIIKVFSHENHGVSYTRNRGIEISQGEYICFVDADDYLIPNGYRYLIDQYLEPSIDILSFWALTLDKKTKANYVENYDVTGKICYEVKGKDFLKNSIQTFIWSSLYKREFLSDHNIKFNIDMNIGEDCLFNINLYLKEPNIRMVSSRIYRYDLQENSTIHQRNYPAMRKSIKSYHILLKEIQEKIEINKQDYPLCLGLKNIIINQIIPFISRILSSDLTISEMKQLKEQLKKENILPIKIKNSKSFIINFIFNTPLFIRVYQSAYQYIFIPYILPHLSRN